MPPTKGKGRGKRTQPEPESDVGEILADIHPVQAMQDDLARDTPTEQDVCDDSAEDEMVAKKNKMPELESAKTVSDHRRKWDRDEYEKIARERLAAESLFDEDEKEKPVKRELLKPREYKVDLDSKLGKSSVITKTTPASQQGGYYCNVCDCVVKDSINFLDHINGKKHQRNLGMSMKIERSSLDQVRARFEMNKKKREEKKKEYDFEERMKELKEEEEKQKAYRREKRKRKANTDTDQDMDSDMAAVMGFSGFGTSKK
ncbi:zinc finger matrin-type protein 2-like [Gigantopelta aegis]|uniref:zinc finger matrin-type protein 2-like n=1 Tax=Gigantopelta aegis TaxID=1735272 RepID=UPI001B889EFF|nr:zinc finger matrin-type protein 2-like [Gigantopelta aegis]